METETIRSESEEETILTGEHFGSKLKKGDVVILEGELGAGKTEFVKGICRFFNVEDLVTSPTFTIINQYAGETPEGDNITIYHADLYRIEKQEDLLQVGFDDMVFTHNAIKLIEWPERAFGLLPDSYWSVKMSSNDENDFVRQITIERHISLHA